MECGLLSQGLCGLILSRWPWHEPFGQRIFTWQIYFFSLVYPRFISKFLWCKIHFVFFFSESLVHFRKLEPVNFWGPSIRWDIRYWFVTNWLAGSLLCHFKVGWTPNLCGWSVPGSWFMFLLQFFSIALWHNIFDYKRYFLMSLFKFWNNETVFPTYLQNEKWMHLERLWVLMEMLTHSHEWQSF